MTSSGDRTPYFLYPGLLHAAAGPGRISTVLGSCIAVCLWDGKRRTGGMNHFLLPFWNGEGLPTPRYGNVAIPRLVEALGRLGSPPGDLVAKFFGGASLWGGGEGGLAIGARNADLAARLLDEAGIPVIGADTGGRCGRKILFDLSTGQVLLKRQPERPLSSDHPSATGPLSASRSNGVRVSG